MTKQEIHKQILKEIDSIPPIPENINTIKALIKNPNASIEKISFYVKLDPALTADLIKIANSAWYMTRTKVGTAERAITTIGLRQFETVLLSLAAKKVLSERYQFAEQIWEHSYKCAFYAQQLAKMISLTVELENAYTAGLLHDIGKLVLLTLDSNMVERIVTLSEKKNIPIHEIEKLAIGLSHADIGELIASNWNFPSHLAVAIGHHHDPKLVKEEWQTLTYITYLANILSQDDEASPDLFNKIDKKVLDFFNIDSDKKLEITMRTLYEFYKSVADALKF